METESRHFERMARKVKRRQHFVTQARPGFDQRLDEAPPGFPIGAEAGGGRIDGALQQDGGAIVQRMGQRGFRVDPFETVRGQRELFEAGGADGHGMDGGAEIVGEAGERESGGTRAAADLGRGFVDRDRVPGARQQNGGSQAVGAGADYQGARFDERGQRWLL